MNIEENIRSIVGAEVARAMEPYQHMLVSLQATGAVIQKLSDAFAGLTPHELGLKELELREVERNKQLVRETKEQLAKERRYVVKAPSEVGGHWSVEKRAAVQCAIIGCKRPHRSKGFCATHYQKYRLLKETGRLPASWVGAAPQSLQNITLPRGHAGQRALKATKRDALRDAEATLKRKVKKVPNHGKVRHPMARQ